MARKTKEVVIETEGRDKGKTFLLTEMDAERTEKWLMRRALLATCADEFRLREIERLMDEMWACVQIKPGSGVPRKLIADDVEEPETRALLRTEVMNLHTGFLVADEGLTSTSGMSSAT